MIVCLCYPAAPLFCIMRKENLIDFVKIFQPVLFSSRTLHVSFQFNVKFTLFWREQQKQIIVCFLKLSIFDWIGKNAFLFSTFWNKLCLYCSGTLVFQFNGKRRQKQECVYMHLHHCIHTLLNAPLCSLCIFQILGNHGPPRPFFGLDRFLVFSTIGLIPSYLASVLSSWKFRSNSNIYLIFYSLSKVLMWFCTCC